MENVEDVDQLSLEPQVKRPFITKFFRELNLHQNQMVKRAKRKKKTIKPVANPIHLEKMEALGLSPVSFKKLPEVIKDGDRILGHWRNDQIHGQAQIQYHNGIVFKGVYQNGIKIKGHFSFPNGFQYIGNCFGNRFQGEGTVFFPSGKMISGEWRDYDVIGNGKIEYPHGQVYFGGIQKFQKHGNGYLFFKDSSKYEGEFKNGQITGFGRYYVDDELVCEGDWLDGELQGAEESTKGAVMTIQKQNSRGSRVSSEVSITFDDDTQ